MTATYHELCAQACSAGEDKDCSVKALAAAIGVTYQYALGALAVKGRMPRCGTPSGLTVSALRDLGWHATPVPLDTIAGRTVRTVVRELPSGTYLINIKDHILCVRDGRAVDWSAGSLNRVKEVWRIDQWYCETCGGTHGVDEVELFPESFHELPQAIRATLYHYSFQRASQYYPSVETKRMCPPCAWKYREDIVSLFPHEERKVKP